MEPLKRKMQAGDNFKITQEHIDEGKTWDCKNCPMALALLDTFGVFDVEGTKCKYIASLTYISLYPKTETNFNQSRTERQFILIEKKLAAWIEKFDEDRTSARPIEIGVRRVVNAPSELIAFIYPVKHF